MPRRLLAQCRSAPEPSGPLSSLATAAAAVAAVTAVTAVALLAAATASAVQAASPLLETVKQNPALARQMCARFKQLNAAGQSATSPPSIAAVASAQGLTPTDAEILITYVIGLNCPDVR